MSENDTRVIHGGYTLRMAHSQRLGSVQKEIEAAGVTVSTKALQQIADTLEMGSRSGPNGHRRFTDAEVATLREIVDLWQTGWWTLPELLDLLTAAAVDGLRRQSADVWYQTWHRLDLLRARLGAAP